LAIVAVIVFDIDAESYVKARVAKVLEAPVPEEKKPADKPTDK